MALVPPDDVQTIAFRGDLAVPRIRPYSVALGARRG